MCCFIGKKNNLKKKLLLYCLELFLHLSTYGFACAIYGLKYKNVSQCYFSSKQYTTYDGKRGKNFEPVHRPNRIQANLQYPSISLGAKTDALNLGFHIYIYPTRYKPQFKTTWWPEFREIIFILAVQIFRALTSDLHFDTHFHYTPVVHQKSHCLSQESSWDTAETHHNPSLLLCNCQHQYTLNKTS